MKFATLIAAVLFAAASGRAAIFEPVSHEKVALELELSELAYENAYFVKDLGGGRTFVSYQAVGVPDERAIYGLILDGKRRSVLRARNWMPSGELIAGEDAQVFSFAISPAGTFAAATVGWRSPSLRVFNGVVLLRKKASGWQAFRLIKAEAALHDVEFGPNDSLLLTARFDHRGDAVDGPPLLIVADAYGRVRGEFLRPGHPHPRPEAAATFRSSIQRLGDDRFAVVDGLHERLTTFSLDVPGRLSAPKKTAFTVPFTFRVPDARARDLVTIALDAPPGVIEKQSPVVRAHIGGDGRVYAVRQLQNTSSPGILVAAYSATKLLGSWTLSRGARAVWWHDDTLNLITSLTPDDVLMESIRFRRPDS